MIGIRVIALAGAFALTGCWCSNIGSLYKPDAMAGPIADGVYAGPSDIMVMRRVPDGRYAVLTGTPVGDGTRMTATNGGKPRPVWMVPLPGKPGTFVAQVENENGIIYAAIRTEKDGFALARPRCEDPDDRKLAEGLASIERTLDNCVFADRQSLETAMGRFVAKAKPSRWTSYRPRKK